MVICAILECESKPIKINKWDSSAVKNALDDAARKVLTEKYELKESNYLMDLRLLICTISVGFALFAVAWDYLRPFPESRPVLIICVISYFVMMGVLTLYTMLVEKGIFCVAVEKDVAGIDKDNTWKLTSQLKRYDDQYTIQLSYANGTTGQTGTATLTKSVGSFFDEGGVLHYDIFEKEFCKLKDSLSDNKKKQ